MNREGFHYARWISVMTRRWQQRGVLRTVGDASLTFLARIGTGVIGYRLSTQEGDFHEAGRLGR